MSVEAASPAEYKAARMDLLKEEKAATKLLDEIAARRRALPCVKVDNPESFIFQGPNSTKLTLLDLFDSCQQLIIYHFMPISADAEPCGGCSFLMDHVAHLGHLNSRETSFVAVTTAPFERIDAYKQRMGWKFPFYSSLHTFDEHDAKGDVVEEITWRPDTGSFKLAVFKKEGDEVFHTYETTRRGVEVMLSTYAMLDMTSMGRQEVDHGMKQFKLHDQY